MIVVDASAAVAALLTDGPSRAALSEEPLHTPHLIDAEVASGLRRRVRVGAISATAGWTALDTWRRIGMTRYPVSWLLGRIWELRDNISAYDASYIALAEHLKCGLLTADRRLAGAPGTRCPITVVTR